MLTIEAACALAAGIARFDEEHPDVPIYTCAVDDSLDERGFIVPGLGDVGNRLYATE